MVVDDARRVHRATGMHHTTDDMGRGDGRRNIATRVHRLQLRAVQGATKALEEPPRHTVHRCQYDRVGSYQRADLAHHVPQCRGFDRQHHQILYPQCGGIGNGLDRMVLRAQAQALGLQGHQRGSTRKYVHLAPRACEARPQPATNGATAHHTDSIKRFDHLAGTHLKPSAGAGWTGCKHSYPQRSPQKPGVTGGLWMQD